MTRYYFCPAEGGGDFGERCRALLVDAGLAEVGRPELAHFAVAPLLRRKLTADELAAPDLGVLVFHPSLLPLRRGPDAVRHAVAAGDAFTGATWFWADDGLDTGDICEQELVAVPAGLSPRELYDHVIVPAGLRCLGRAARQIAHGCERRVAQDQAAATYQTWLRKPAPARAEA